jgi:hypothetical protein
MNRENSSIAPAVSEADLATLLIAMAKANWELDSFSTLDLYNLDRLQQLQW